jgi:hypothetical protein
VAEPDAVGGGDDLEPLARGERAVDLVDRLARRRLLVGDRMGDVAQSRAGRDQPVKKGVAVGGGPGQPGDRGSVGRDARIHQPRHRRIERGQSLDQCTVFELHRVEVFEGGLERDRVVDVIGRRRLIG